MALPARLRRLALAAGAVAATVVALGGLCGCSGDASATITRLDPGGVVWLCRPGLAADPCTSPLAYTQVNAAGYTVIKSARPLRRSRFDCFYVYPTVSPEASTNSNLEVQPAEVNVAVEQAARFSQLCDVWAPVYRQRTLASISTGLDDRRADQLAYRSLLVAWHDYLVRHNDRRPIVFIGASQGAAMLTRLIATQVDPNPRLRRRMVSAILVGGNVEVPSGYDYDGSFQNIPNCHSVHQTGCVIAYSSFETPPPKNSLFGRAGQGMSLESGQADSLGRAVVCTNPAALGSYGTAAMDSFFPTSQSMPTGITVTTPWVLYPDLYNAQCEGVDGATWLQITPDPDTGDPRPRVTATLGPQWGLDVDDLNLALGNLLYDLRGQEAAYEAAHR